MTKISRLALAAVAVLALNSTNASAHQRDDKRWSFGGAITSGPNDPKKLDPVNILFLPHGIRYTTEGETDDFTRLDGHLSQHMRPNYTNDTTLRDGLREKYCRNDKYLSFPARTEPRRGSNFNWVLWKGGQPGPEDRCKTRYHSRIWYDNNHLSTRGLREGHSPDSETWVISSNHHESLNIIRGTKKAQFHYIDMPWEMVETRLLQKMRRPGRDDAHVDPLQQGAKRGHCGEPRWRPLPGSMGYFGGVKEGELPRGASRKGFYSDGWITRISLLHCAR